MSYDLNGNRSRIGGSWAGTGLPDQLTSGTYNAANQQTAFSGQTLTYDLNGNLTNDGTRTYTWNARNQLVVISSGAATIASFQYDAFGRRLNKTIAGTSTGFVHDGANTVQELSGASPAANLLTGGIDENFLRSDASGTFNFLSDGLGSTLGLLDSAGNLQTQYTYQPFGVTSITGSSGNSFQFTGRENDGTGLYHYRARYYHPTLHRFIGEDPIEFNGGDVNLYVHARNDPINRIDPLGLSDILIDVTRTTMTANSTIGDLSLNGDPAGFTLELPDRGNQSYISNIPANTYFAEIYTRENGDRVLRLKDVHHRPDILFHSGNYPRDTKGCLLPGNTKGKDFVGGSRKTMKKIMDLVDLTKNIDSSRNESTNIIVTIK